MVDVTAKPLVAEQGAIRVDPYAQPSTPVPNGSVNGLPPSVARTLGAANSSHAPVNPDANGDGELDEEEVGHLQQAAAQGDKESWDLLNALKLPLGIAAGAAGLYAATRGGLSLVDAVGKANGMSMFGDQQRSPNGAKMPPQKLLANPVKKLTGPETHKALPAPLLALPDPTPRTAPSSATIPHPEENIGDFPGSKLGQAMRNAAKAARRLH